MVLDYCTCLAIKKRTGSFPKTALSLFHMQAAADGEITKDLIQEYVSGIGALARVGFAMDSEFPVFCGRIAMRNNEKGKGE